MSMKEDARTYSTEKVEIGLSEEEGGTIRKVRPRPKRKKMQKTAGEPATLATLRHSETLTD
jgi:hypothetical protein